MNIWLKRVSLILPPVIIAGVYFNIIPVGPDIRKRIDLMLKDEKAVPEKKFFPMIKRVHGEVYIKDHPSFSPVLIKGGEILKSGQSLATGESSSVLLSYKGSDWWQMRISSNSQVNIDELMKQTDGETTVVYLMKGGLTLTMKNNTGALKRMNVRTKFASFAVRGTTLAVLTDGETRSLMTVHDGIVEAENFKFMDKTSVREGYTYLVNREGEKKLQLDLDALDLFNWDLNNLEQELPALDKVIGSIGDLGPTPDDKEKEKLRFLKEIDESIVHFKQRNEKLLSELEILLENAVQSKAGLKAEAIRIEKDMHCLETSASECNLFNEKILLMRGFPRTWGNSRYRSSLVVGLGKYLQERKEEVSGREEEAKILSQLMAARDAVLKAVESDRASEKNLDKLIPALQAERLRR